MFRNTRSVNVPFLLWKFETSAGNMIYWPFLNYDIKNLVNMKVKTSKSQRGN